LYTAVENSLFASFKINGLEKVTDQTLDGQGFEVAANDVNWNKFYLVASAPVSIFPLSSTTAPSNENLT
jgi:hypothetical protein